MQKHNNIKALFFLGVFSMLLLHKALPHWHHEDEIEHSHNAIEHGDSLNHHHHISEKQSSLVAFLDMVLEMHVHLVVSNELLLTQESSIKHLKVKKDINAPNSVVQYHSTINYDETEKIKVYHPPNNYFNAYLSSLDSRGPPTLG
jgi:hypothetical protein